MSIIDIVVIASPFHRHHTGADGTLGRADFTEHRAICGGAFACDYLPAMTACGDMIGGEGVAACVQMGKRLPQSQSAVGDGTQSAPRGSARLEIAIHFGEGFKIAFRCDGGGIEVVYFRPPCRFGQRKDSGKKRGSGKACHGKGFAHFLGKRFEQSASRNGAGAGPEASNPCVGTGSAKYLSVTCQILQQINES